MCLRSQGLTDVSYNAINYGFLCKLIENILNKSCNLRAYFFFNDKLVGSLHKYKCIMLLMSAGAAQADIAEKEEGGPGGGGLLKPLWPATSSPSMVHETSGHAWKTEQNFVCGRECKKTFGSASSTGAAAGWRFK